MITRSKTSHIGSCFSIADLIAVLYSSVMNIEPSSPEYEDRDRLILSKGHACAVVYAALAENKFFPRHDLLDYAKSSSIFSSHISHKVPGVEFSTGSLGHGLPHGVGRALAARMKGKPWQTYVVLGDGEIAEGSNWEAMLFAAHHHLGNITLIVDRNNLQSFGTTDETLKLNPLEEKFTSFGWQVETVDGHSHPDIFSAINKAKVNQSVPTVILASTVKGKGVSFMENSVAWHYKSPTFEEFCAGLREITKDK